MITSPFSFFVLARRFFPLFWVQFLGAFNDNVFKNAMVMLITFQLAQSASDAGFLITLAAGVFILPFFLFSAFAGQIADRFDKTLLIRKIKLAEILVMATGAIAFLMQDLVMLFVVLFLMGLQSTFFGPIKYSILPEHLGEDELLHGNGWFSASTFVAILLGTLIGGLVVLSESGAQWMAALVVIMAILGYLASLFVPPSHGGHEVPVQLNFLKSTWTEIQHSRQFPQAFFAVLAISWFWFLGATYLSQMPVLVKELLLADDKVVVAFLTTFSVGIAIGAWIVSRMKLRVRSVSQIGWLVWMLVGISVAMIISNLLLNQLPTIETSMTLSEFISTPMALMVMLLMGAIATLGGIFIVPLYTLLQVKTPEDSRSRMVAVNNITNSVFMVVSSLLIMACYAFGADLIQILALIAVFNLVVAWWFSKRSQRLSIDNA